MNDFHPWQSRPKRYRIRPSYEEYRSRRRIPWGWIVAIAATIAIAGAMALAYDAESSMLPPRPGTEKVLPAPVGRHERQLWCRYAPHVRPGNPACTKAGYR